MIMIGQSKRLSEPLRWTRAGKWAVAVAGACLALAVAGLGLFALLGGSGTGDRVGCIDVTFASYVGGANLHACGRQARMVCASPSGGLASNGELESECRRWDYPFGGEHGSH